MNINVTGFLVPLLLSFCAINIAWIDPINDRTEEGNRLYEEKKYGDAQKKYQDAQTLDPESHELYYNLASALYKQQKFNEAEGLYNKVLDADNIKLKADALHNLGNIKVKKNELEQALKYYRQSIRLQPSDQDTRMNYEQALQMLQQQQQQKQQDKQQQQQNQKNQDDKENQNQQQNQQQNKDKNQESQQDQQQNSQNDQNSQQQQDQQQNQDQPDQQQQQDQQKSQESQQQQQKQDQQESQAQQNNSQQQKQPLTKEQLEKLKEQFKPDEQIEANPYLRALEKQEFENRKKQVYGDSKLYIEKDW